MPGQVVPRGELRGRRCFLLPLLVNGFVGCLLSFMASGWLFPSSAAAGCGDYLTLNGGPVVPGHALGMPTDAARSESLTLGQPAESLPGPVPCDGVWCGRRTPVPWDAPSSAVPRMASELWVWASPVSETTQRLVSRHWRSERLEWPSTFSSRLERPPRVV